MIDVFVAAYPYAVEVVDINDFPYEAGCHGCLRCELVGECDRKDGFQEFYSNLVNTCDVLVFGMNLEERYLRPVWKLFLDRSFANGHRTSMMGKHTCYLVAGPLAELPNVRQFLEGKDQVGRENSMGILSDEVEDSRQLEALLDELAARLARAAAAKYQKSVSFLGVGGIKIFRDLIYGMRGVVKDDHRFYKSAGCTISPRMICRTSSTTSSWAPRSCSSPCACRPSSACPPCTSGSTSASWIRESRDGGRDSPWGKVTRNAGGPRV